jgi:hypothetical protein
VTRRLACAAAVLVLALALGACGDDSGHAVAPKVTATGTAPPAPTPQPLDYVGGAKAALKRGATAVADFTFHVAVQPPRMDVNAEQRLTQVRWTGWGNDRATGRADLRTLICEPNCAQGLYQDARAEIVLSAPKTCGGMRFYTRSSMTYDDPDTHKTRAPSTYLRTPPC